MTLMRLKINVSFVVLGAFFNCTSTTCKNVFINTITFLARILKDAIPFPTKDEILCNMPKCFRAFKNVRLVLDSTEIAIAKSKCLTCRINTYSQYKGGQTVKILAGVSPAGLITCHSLAYGGRASDSQILQQSGILERLEPIQDAIMVDKGFLIDEVCCSYGIEVIRPPFLRGQKFSAADAKRSRQIARSRVHIERVFQRVKQFNLLSSRIPWNLIPYIDEIICTIFGLVNLGSSVLSEQRFETDD